MALRRAAARCLQRQLPICRLEWRIETNMVHLNQQRPLHKLASLWQDITLAAATNALRAALANSVAAGSHPFSSSAGASQQRDSSSPQPGQQAQQDTAAASQAQRQQHQHQRSQSSREQETVSAEEAAKFAALADRWWDPAGPFKALHELNPTRCRFIRTGLCDVFGRDAAQAAPLDSLRLLDVGCGGGILSESLALMGASVVGIDVNEEGLRTARAHAELEPGVARALQYRAATTEQLVAEGLLFDAVIASEVVEHVDSVPAFCASLAALTKPGGAVVLSTLNRTPRSLALAVGVGEYLLRWAPVGTHDWNKFITPEELVLLMDGTAGCSSQAAVQHGLGGPGGEQQQQEQQQQQQPGGSTGAHNVEGVASGGVQLEQLAGMVFDPLSWRWRLSTDTAVNYIALFRKPL